MAPLNLASGQWSKLTEQAAFEPLKIDTFCCKDNTSGLMYDISYFCINKNNHNISDVFEFRLVSTLNILCCGTSSGLFFLL